MLPHVTEYFSLAVRTFKTYSLSNFWIPNTVLLNIVTMLYIISPGFIYFIWKFVPCDPLHPLLSLLSHVWEPRFSDSVNLDFCFQIPRVSEIIKQYVSSSDLFLLAECLLGSSTLLQMSKFYSFFMAENIPFCTKCTKYTHAHTYIYTTPSLSIHPLIDIR